MSLPTRLGGLGIPVFAEKAYDDYEVSVEITAPLVTIMVLQGDSPPNDVEVNRIKADAMNRREKAILSNSDEIENSLEPNTFIFIYFYLFI